LMSKQDWEQAKADVKKAQSDLEASHANLSSGEAEVESMKARLRVSEEKRNTARLSDKIAEQQLAREERIYKGGYLTTKEIVEAESALRQARVEQRAAEENVHLLGGRPGGGNLMTVEAPIGGRVTERTVTLGETVTAEKTLFTLLNANTVWVQLNVFQKDLGAVRIGAPVTVVADTASGVTFRGSVSSIGETVDETTRTVKVRAVIQNAGGRLRPGVFVHGSLDILNGGSRGITIPQEAVQELQGKSVVFLAEDHAGEFHTQPVTLGEQSGSLVEIRSGLQAGDRIVTKNAFTVKAQAMKGELGHGHAH
jgi:membrane fusion protein, heavy metal efflux system